MFCIIVTSPWHKWQNISVKYGFTLKANHQLQRADKPEWPEEVRTSASEILYFLKSFENLGKNAAMKEQGQEEWDHFTTRKPSWCASAVYLHTPKTKRRKNPQDKETAQHQEPAQNPTRLCQKRAVTKSEYILMVWKIASWIRKYETWQLIATGAKSRGNESLRCNTSWKERKKETLSRCERTVISTSCAAFQHVCL